MAPRSGRARLARAYPVSASRNHIADPFGARSIRIRRPAAAPPLRCRLEGDAGMIVAIGPGFGGVVAAEMEVLRQRIAVRPFAGALVELDRAAGAARSAPPHFRPGAASCRATGSASNCACSAVAPIEAVHRRAADRGARADLWTSTAACSGLLLARRRRRGAAAARQLQPVHLADHGVAADAARAGRRSGWRSVPPTTIFLRSSTRSSVQFMSTCSCDRVRRIGIHSPARQLPGGHHIYTGELGPPHEI